MCFATNHYPELPTKGDSSQYDTNDELKSICERSHEKSPYGRYRVTYRAIYLDEVPEFQAKDLHFMLKNVSPGHF